MTDPAVVIDGRPLVGRRTGIGVHTAEIAGRLGFSPAPLIASHRVIGDRTSIENCRFLSNSYPLGVLWQLMRLPRVAAGADVLWGPHGTLPLTGKTPGVITIHDLTTMTMPSRHRLKTILSFDLLVRSSIRRAAAIAAVSKTTAEEVRRKFGVAIDRIEIVPNGVDPFFSPGLDDRDLLPPPVMGRSYILYAGTLEPRKGVADLAAAWAMLPLPRPLLVVAGGSGWGTERAMERLVRAHPGEVIVTGYVSRGQLRALYRHALLFVYPSHYEGFGLPPLEAMACGAPVITTTGGALAETAAGGAILVEPADPEALHDAIRKVAGDDSLRSDLAARGLAHAARFRWETSAAIMAGILKRVAG